jgi:hypothetical protein
MNIKPAGFGRQVTKCIIKLLKSVTPAGVIFYPLFLQKNNKTIRPISIDGLAFIEDEGRTLQTISCMLTPICSATIVFYVDTLVKHSDLYLECECNLNCGGNPFQSIFAIDTKNEMLKLYHHTTDENAELIDQSSILKASKWNLQGVQELPENHYIYFTDINSIDNVFDLLEIGMADKGTKRHLRTDDDKEIKEYEVYRDETTNRNAALTIWVDQKYIAPPPLLLHSPGAVSEMEYSWWEVFCCSIFRVSVLKGKALPIEKIAFQEYVLSTDENFAPVDGFFAGHGMDMISMERVLSEAAIEYHPRIKELTDADIGELDQMWVDTWEKNVLKLAYDVLSQAMV